MRQDDVAAPDRRLEQPDSGAIATSLVRPGRAIGYLAQSDTLLPWRNLVDNIAWVPNYFGVAKKRRKTRHKPCCSVSAWPVFAQHYPGELSGGMRQRVLIARMLALEPTLLLLDEPMSALDVAARRDLATLIKTDIRARQAAALVVTHSVEEACFLADRILIMTRRPGTIFREIAGDTPDLLDTTMRSLLEALEESHVPA